MRITTTTKWVTSDGQEFDNPDDARRHVEESLAPKKKAPAKAKAPAKKKKARKKKAD